MELWQIGLVVFSIVAVAGLYLAQRRDRSTAQAVKEAMRNPPDREIPGLDTSATPHYLPEKEALRPPPGADSTELTDTARARVRAAVDSDEAVRIPGGWAAKEFATDAVSGWAVLAGATVVVVTDPIESFRELLPVFDSTREKPLVIVAPSFSDEVVSTMRVNQTRRKMRICPVTTTHAADVAETVKSQALDASDLKAGYVPATAVALAPCWVSSENESWIVDVDLRLA